MSAVVGTALVIALCSLALASPAPAHEGADTPRDFTALWREAERWARETDTAPHECVFSLRFDAKTRQLRDGYAATCDEPYRSPFYPWPEPSRPGVRFTVAEVERHGREVDPRRSSASVADHPLEACELVVGFTAEGQGAEAIECYRAHGSVPGQRANTEFIVGAPGDRYLVSSLYERIAHLGDRAVRKMFPARRPDPASEAAMRIEGRVVGKQQDRLLVRGRALPSVIGSATAPGVVTTEARIIVRYPSDDAVRPSYYFGGEHCFEGRRDVVDGRGSQTVEWLYGPCPLEPDDYWIFEQHPLGKRTVWYGPYGAYSACDAERRALRSTRPGVAGHCISKSRTMLRMRQDGSLVVPGDAPPLR